MAQDVTLEDAEFKIKDVEEFPLDAADIPLAEDTCAERPVDVLKCGVIKVLRCGEKKSQQLLQTNERRESLPCSQA